MTTILRCRIIPFCTVGARRIAAGWTMSTIGTSGVLTELLNPGESHSRACFPTWTISRGWAIVRKSSSRGLQARICSASGSPALLPPSDRGIHPTRLQNATVGFSYEGLPNEILSLPWGLSYEKNVTWDASPTEDDPSVGIGALIRPTAVLPLGTMLLNRSHLFLSNIFSTARLTLPRRII